MSDRAYASFTLYHATEEDWQKIKSIFADAGLDEMLHDQSTLAANDALPKLPFEGTEDELSLGTLHTLCAEIATQCPDTVFHGYQDYCYEYTGDIDIQTTDLGYWHGEPDNTGNVQLTHSRIQALYGMFGGTDEFMEQVANVTGANHIRSIGLWAQGKGVVPLTIEEQP